MVKQRDISIDIVKFLAVFLIINSHADIMYAKFSSLATGGAIGDALFLFCSGYTLFWSGTKRFDNWYKRRISRIYPSVIACLGIAIIFGYEHIDKLTYVKIGGGEFVIAIMTYYILLYAVQRYCMKHFKWIVAAVVVATLVAYWFFPYKYETSVKGIYGITTLFRWIPYFGMMLMGAWIGLKVKDGVMNVKTRWTDGLLLLVCIGVFYGVQLLSRRYAVIAPWQIVTLPFLAGVVYYIWNLQCPMFTADIRKQVLQQGDNAHRWALSRIIPYPAISLHRCVKLYISTQSAHNHRIHSAHGLCVPLCGASIQPNVQDRGV